jgi:hypothetical protein
VFIDSTSVSVMDIVSGEVTSSYGVEMQPLTVAFNMDESMLAVSFKGGDLSLVPTAGGEAHVLFTNTGVPRTCFDPLGRYVASFDFSGSLCLFPIPTGRPVQQLPTEEFLDHLRSQTNVRIVPDKSQPTGFRVTLEPFSGWEALPGR